MPGVKEKASTVVHVDGERVSNMTNSLYDALTLIIMFA